MITSRTALRLILPAFALVAAALSIPSAAFAQSYGQLPTQPVVPAPTLANKHQAPGSALPGAESSADEVAKPDKPVADMEPTAALFDAINRGDIATARDAINRGADLNGRNILGMGPTELSIDLGRKDITFLLLSLRGAVGVSAQPSATSATAAVPPAGTATRRTAAAQAVAKPVPAPRQTATATAAARRDPVVPAPSPARQFATSGSGGGTPIPQMGFLGFGSAAPSATQ